MDISSPEGMSISKGMKIPIAEYENAINSHSNFNFLTQFQQLNISMFGELLKIFS